MQGYGKPDGQLHGCNAEGAGPAPSCGGLHFGQGPNHDCCSGTGDCLYSSLWITVTPMNMARLHLRTRMSPQITMISTRPPRPSRLPGLYRRTCSHHLSSRTSRMTIKLHIWQQYLASNQPNDGLSLMKNMSKDNGSHHPCLLPWTWTSSLPGQSPRFGST